MAAHIVQGGPQKEELVQRPIKGAGGVATSISSREKKSCLQNDAERWPRWAGQYASGAVIGHAARRMDGQSVCLFACCCLLPAGCGGAAAALKSVLQWQEGGATF